ncbi:MAG TPA: L,D-transpeptidase [Longimicrobiales bacterium]
MNKRRGVLIAAVAAVQLIACEQPVDDCYNAAMTGPIDARAPAQQPEPITAPDTTLRLILNIPAYTVHVFEDDTETGSYRVAVGSARYPTRVGTFAITSITWNPWWVPPPSDWARNEKKTPPGPNNPMGKVKINYGPAYYLHGTPDSLRLGRPLSHGCVRMQNADAVALALYLQRATYAPISEAEQTRLLSDWDNSRTINLPTPVFLEIHYDVVVVTDSLVVIYPDIYDKLDGTIARAVVQELAAAGVPAHEIDTAAVAEFAKEARRGGRVAVSKLRR